MAAQKNDEILTLAQTAVLLGVSTRTLTRFMDRGEIHGFMIGKRWKFMRSEIVDYLDRQQQKDPTYMDRQLAAVRADGAKLANQFQEVLGQLGPEEKQAFIDSFFEMLGASKWGQRIIGHIDQETRVADSPREPVR